jgi:hypothetical protein
MKGGEPPRGVAGDAREHLRHLFRAQRGDVDTIELILDALGRHRDSR